MTKKLKHQLPRKLTKFLGGREYYDRYDRIIDINTLPDDDVIPSGCPHDPNTVLVTVQSIRQQAIADRKAQAHLSKSTTLS